MADLMGARCESRLASTTEIRSSDREYRPIARCRLNAGHLGEHESGYRRWGAEQEAVRRVPERRGQYIKVSIVLDHRLGRVHLVTANRDEAVEAMTALLAKQDGDPLSTSLCAGVVRRDGDRNEPLQFGTTRN